MRPEAVRPRGKKGPWLLGLSTHSRSEGVPVRYHNDGSKELNACIRFFLHMVYLKPKHKSLLFADNMYGINMHTHIHLQWCFSWLTRPCFCLWFLPLPFACINHSLYLLGDPSSYARVANIHPPSSLVSYQLFSPCCLTRPEDTPQIKLHIYIDDITTSAVPSDTVPNDQIFCQNLVSSGWKKGGEVLPFDLLICTDPDQSVQMLCWSHVAHSHPSSCQTPRTAPLSVRLVEMLPGRDYSQGRRVCK